jgi:hypothetical protein
MKKGPRANARGPLIIRPSGADAGQDDYILLVVFMAILFIAMLPPI